MLREAHFSRHRR